MVEIGLDEIFFVVKWVARNLGRSKIGFTEPVSMSCKIPELVGEKMELGVA